MKILFAIPFFSPRFGGTVNSVFLLSKELSKRGHDIIIITSDLNYDKNYVKTLEELGVSIILFHCAVNFGPFIYTPYLKKWLKNNIQDYDIIHLHSYRTYINIQISKSIIKKNIPLILQAHGSVLPIFEKKLIKKVFDVIWGENFLKIAIKCIALTKTESDQYIKMGVPEEKIVIIPNGLDLSQFSNLPERGTFRKKYGISDNKQIILFLGRIHKIKGIDLLIDAYSLVLKDLPHARLVIAGPDDGYLLTIQEQIQRLNLKMAPLITGPLYDRDKLEAYVDADVYVLPSRYEIFGNTILEAWACGTPVIVTDSCAISSVAQHGGFVVKRDPIELATAIKRLLIKESLWEVYSNNGKILVNKEFNLESVVAKIEACYRQVI